MASLTDLLAAMQNGVTAINNLNSTLQTVFPQATAYSTSAGAGPIGFISVVTSSGATVKVPVYP